MPQNLSTRIVSKWFLCAAVGLSLLLWSLVVVGTAVAEPVQEQIGETPASSESAPPANENAGEGAATEATAPQQPEPVAGAGNEAGGEPVAAQGGESSETNPPAEQPASEPVQEVVQPVEEQVKEPVVEHVVEVAGPTEPVVEHVQEAVSPISEPVKEQAKEPLTLSEVTKEPATATPSGAGPSAQDATAAGAPASSEASGLLVATVAPTSGGPGEPPTASSAPVALNGVPPHLTAAQREGELSCQLSGLGGAATENCAASWLSHEPLLVAPPGALVVAAAARASDPADGTPGGSDAPFGGGHSFIPPPGPAPTGAVGGSAAGGAGGGLSGFFTLAGLLLLAGPRAMRRLRLLAKPWLTAFFVLIPERPG